MTTRQSIKVGGLHPNQTYSVQVYSEKQLSSGQIIDSPKSQSFTFTTSATSNSGSSFSNTNSLSDTQLSGGSVFAGTFAPGVGNTPLFDGVTGLPLTLDASNSGVVLSQYGLGGFNSGVPEFAIDSITGKAYFAGSVSAGQVKIGPNVDPTQTKTGLYINSKNYWYDDGSWSAASSDIAGALTNKNSSNTLILPDAPVWDNINTNWTGSTLNLAWTFNLSGNNNHFAKDFIISFTVGTFIQTITVPVSSTSYVLNMSQNKALFGVPVTSFTSISIVTEDTFGNKSTYPSLLSPIPTYTSSLTAPSSISLSPINNGYTVTYTKPTDITFSYISIEESETSGTATDFKAVYSGVGVVSSTDPTKYVVTILAQNLNRRWVRARFYDDAGGHSGYGPSIVGYIDPTAPVSINTDEPNDVTVTFSAFQTINSVAKSGENIEIDVTLPSTKAGQTFIVQLAPTLNTALIGTFYFQYNSSLGLNQQFIITKQSAFSQFGTYYDEFTGNITSVAATGIRSVSPPTFTIDKRVSSLSSVTPNPTVLANADGYTAVFDFSNTNATYAEVYAKYTSWSGITSPIDYITSSYSSGGTSGGNTIVINTVKDNDGNILTSIPTGYKITGIGIPNNTYVTNVSGSAPTFTITLSNNLTSDASGIYTMNALVYQGSGPANVFSTLYIPTYVIVRYYDDFGNTSIVSSETSVTPTNPETITSFTNAVNISGTAGSVYVGTSPAVSGSRVILSGSGNSNNPTGFSGLFAYDNSNNITTRILANPTGGAYTFATTSAHIADWNITSSSIENTISGTPSFYTGLSGSGTYSIWAGSSTSGGDSSANFYVKPDGSVQAKKISIVGDGTNDVSLNINNNFTVDKTGVLTATGAVISGNLTATTGNFSGDVRIASTGSLYSGTKLTGSITNVQSGTPAAGQVTYTIANTLTSNSTVYISGLTPVGYNGVFKVISATSSAFVVANATTGTSSGTGYVYDTTTGYVLNPSGLSFNTSGTKGITTIDSSSGLFTTKLANIGGWTIDSSNIKQTSNSGTLTLFSGDSTHVPSITTTAGGYSAYMSAAANPGDVVFSAGNGNFQVTANGSVTMTGSLNISGYATSSDLSGKISTGGAATDVNNNSTTISGGKIRTGIIVSNNISGVQDATAFTSAGMAINLTTGAIAAKNFLIDYLGNASFSGTINSSTITASTITASTFTSPNYVGGQGITISSSSSTDSIIFNSSSGRSAQISMGDSSNALRIFAPGLADAFDIYGSGSTGTPNTNLSKQPFRIWADDPYLASAVGSVPAVDSALAVRNIQISANGLTSGMPAGSYNGDIWIQYV